VLYYSGTVFSGDYPEEGEPLEGHSPQWLEAWNNQRVGVATAPSVLGPWTRAEQPVLEVRKDRWDCVMTTNPTVAVDDNGDILMIYKSISKPYIGATLPAAFQLGGAKASQPTGPFSRIQDNPLFSHAGELDLEDPFIWYQDNSYHMLAKDMDGSACGQAKAGVTDSRNIVIPLKM